MDLEKLVIDNIKRIRKEKRISQEQLAEKCHTATSYIGLLETYKNVPKLSTIQKIAEALNVEPQVLFQNPNNADNKGKIEKISDALMSSIKEEIISTLEKYI